MKKSPFSKRAPPISKQILTPTKQIPKQQTNLTKTLQDSLISGFGIGIGNSIAHNLMNGLFSTKQNSYPQNDKHNCDHIITELNNCISLNRDCNNLYVKFNLHKCQYERYEEKTKHDNY